MATELLEEIELATPVRHEVILASLQGVDEVREISLDLIDPDPEQARDEGADDSIGDALGADAVLPPIEVRPHPDPERVAAGVFWQIIDGERRWRGSRKAGRETIRAIINRQPLDAGDRLLRQTRLNAGKHLSPMEEARTWKRIIDAKGWSQQDLATALGKPKSTVGDRLAILDAPAPFQKFFLDGTLTAAAAPIVRQFAEVPEKILKKVVEEVTDDWNWDEAIREGKPVELKDVKRVLEEVILHEELRELYDADLRERYTAAGLDTVTIKGKRYATDVEAYDKMEQRVLAAKANAEGEAATHAKRPPMSSFGREQRARMKAAKKKAADRRAQFTAISAKLPGAIDKKWGQFLVAGIVQEIHQDTARNFCTALGLETVKPKNGQWRRYGNAIEAYAATLDVAGLVRLALQLAFAADLGVSPYGGRSADRLKEAAKLARVDVAKIKAPDPDAEKKKAKTASKSATKKGEPKRARYVAAPDFMKPMQPDAALAAIIGTGPMPRTDVTKKLWGYIKKHGLQDAKERRQINADDKLLPVFGGKGHVSMFEMTKLINKHLSPVK